MAGEPILIAQNCALVLVKEPVLRSASSERRMPDLSFLTKLAEAIGAPFLNLCDDVDFVIDQAMRDRIAKLRRRSLVLLGGLLEGAVTQIALSMLLEGYDVYVCADRVVTEDLAREHVFLECIRFCNGHIVTSRQILLELVSQEKDEAARAPLEALLKAGAAG